MSKIPGDVLLDHTWALLQDPYRFISKRCNAHRSDVIQTRLMLRRTLCMRGRDAAELFCDPELFLRRGASPLRVQRTLFGVGGVQGLDGAEHAQRKQLLLSLMSPDEVQRLGATFDALLAVYARKWETLEYVPLYEELGEALTRTVCAWAGVPVTDRELRARTQDLRSLFEGAGAVGPRHRAARHARARTEHWLAQQIAEIRATPAHHERSDAATRIALYRDSEGGWLEPEVAAVELLNVLRPTVAVAVYLVFIVHALAEHPTCRGDLDADVGYVEPFVHEVRRFYPFFPAVPALVRRDFEWRGHAFREGTRVLLDLYGTNHDPRIWDGPDVFRPERFKSWEGSPYDFIPQGPGRHDIHHRCAGEWVTIELMRRMSHFLVHDITYEIPDQDLRIDFARLPALPCSRMLLSEVRWIP